MTTIKQHFDKLIEDTLPGESAEAARKAAPDVREHLRKHEDLPTQENPTTRLIGSYQRSTAVQELKDVDILVFIDAEEGDYTPKEMLDLLRKALNDYPASESSTRKQNRSVRIHLTDVDVDLDIVPALNHTDDNSRPLRIPDGDAGRWIDTHPLRYAELLTELNKREEHYGRVKPLIRLFKVWRNEHLTGTKKPKSMWLEVLAFNAVSEGSVKPKEDGYAQAFRDLLKYAVDKLAPWTDLGMAPTIYDPVLTTTSITGDWPVESWKAVVARLRTDLASADAALAEQDADEAAKHWSKVFGAAWPEDAEAKSALYKSIVAGTAVGTAAGSLLAAKPAAASTFPVPAARAYGRNSE